MPEDEVSIASPLRFPIVSLGAEYLVMGRLLRRNVLAYKAPPHNEGYDLICIHPDPRRRPKPGTTGQIRVQVKSRYATDCDRAVYLFNESLAAFDFLVVVFLNIGEFGRGRTGRAGARDPEFYTFDRDAVRRYHHPTGDRPKVKLRGVAPGELAMFKDDVGFEQIAKRLRVARPVRR